MNERAAIYARVSSDIQRDNYSIPSQIKEMVNFATQRGYSLVGDRYVDAETGRDSHKKRSAIPAFVDDYTSRELSRPRLDSALLFLESTGFDVLIVHAIDRLARDPYFRQTIEREFIARGARVEYVLGNYEETPEGEVRKDLDATFAKWENAKRVERCNRGKKRKAETGKFVSGIVPFGYRKDEVALGGLAIFEPEAEIVRFIFALFVEKRLSLNQIVKELQSQGTKTYEKKDVWAKSSIHRILENTTYIGYFFYNKYIRQGKRLVFRDQSEWIKINCSPIIEPETFLQAQKLLEDNKAYMRNLSRRFYLLTGMVVCGECNKAYKTQTAKAGKNRRSNDASSYRHRISQGGCLNRSISARILDEMVWDGVTKILWRPESIREGYEQMMEQEQEKRSRQIKHFETLQSIITKLQARQVKLRSMYLDPDLGMTKIEYLEQKEVIDGQMNVAVTEADKITQELQSIPTSEDLQSLEHLAEKIKHALSQNLIISPEIKRQIMQMLNLKVVISSEGQINLKGWFIQEDDDLLSTTSIRYARLPQRLRARA